MPISPPHHWPRARRLLGLLGLAALLIGLIWFGRVAWHARQAYIHAEELRTTLAQRPPTSASAAAACTSGAATADALDALAGDLRPARGLLTRLGWVPRYGGLLAQTPNLLDAAQAGGAAGRALCQGLAPLFPLIDQRQRGASGEELLAQALPLAGQAQPMLDALADALAQLDAALGRLDLDQLERSTRAPTPALRDARARLPEARAALEVGRALLPIGASALRPGPPRRYLLLAQNSGELRATGGYIGTLGSVLVDGGRVSIESFHDTYDFGAAAPPDIEMPVSHVRYEQIVGWYLRDANWHADFPRSAQTIAYFWRLNQRPPLDGVIGVDLFAFQQLLAPLGALDVPGYGPVRAEDGLEALFALYKTRDKQLIGGLLRAALLRLGQLTPGEGLALARALDRALLERHILIALSDPEAQALARARRWDGALAEAAGDYLMVADADFGFSEVALFVDARIGYSVTLGADMRPLTATVTLDYGNGYDLWRQGHTSEIVGGYHCLRENLRGCYRNFVRVYAPASAEGFASAGLDGHPERGVERGRALWADYMLLVPGELRSAHISYRPGAPAPGGVYRLYVQKQPGTLAHPLRVVVRAADGQELAIETDLWTDREIAVGRRGGRLELLAPLGPTHPRNAPERLAPRAAFRAGWQQWQRGQADAALDTWRAGRALDHVIDQANMLVARGQPAQAYTVARAAAEIAPQSPRAAFALGYALYALGQPQRALAQLRRAQAHDPANPEIRALIRALRADRHWN